MFDAPPLAEVSVSAAAALFLVAFALSGPHEKLRLLGLWAAVSSIILVALDGAPMGIGLLLGVAAVLAAPVLIDRRQRWLLIAAGLTAIVLILTKGIDTKLRLASIVPALGAGPLLWICFRRFDQTVMTVLWAGTAIGIYINVPDTEQIAVHAAGLSVLALAMIVSRPIRSLTVRVESVLVIGALVVCAGAWGAEGRPAAFIGVIGALGVLLAEPIAALIRRGSRAHPAILIAIHAGVVLVASRLAGVRGDGDELQIVAGALGVAIVLLVALPRQKLPREHSKIWRDLT